MIEIGWIEMPENISEKIFEMSGGESYRKYLFNLLSNKYSLSGGGIDKGILNRHIIKKLYKSLKFDKNMDVWIREIDSVILPVNIINGKSILLFQHIGGGILAPPSLLNMILKKMFYYNLNKIDEIVVVSRYWMEHFQKRGCSNTKIIYNPFDMSQFDFTKDEIIHFKEKYKLAVKPIIYIGNCQEWKGVVESYKELKDLDAYLVTSGKRTVNIPAINLYMNYRDYLLLLKASSVVVAMSKFPEGWCRTAHEAMLCKTPVVGSGLGGMGELLEDGKQIICRDFNKLKEGVEYAMEHPEMGEDGYHYASQKQFTVEHFNKEWTELIRGMVE